MTLTIGNYTFTEEQLKKTTQKQIVEAHLRTFHKITVNDAFYKYSITDLASVIKHLRRNGLKIKTIDKYEKNKFGRKVPYGEYVLED